MKIQNLELGSLRVENITQRTFCIVGGKGTGKTQTLKMLAVKAEELKLPLVVFDLLNVIRIQGWNRITVARKSYTVGGELGYKMQRIMQKRLIISFVDMNQDESSKFIDDMFRTWNFSNGLIFVDEVHEIAPERGMQMEYSSEFERAIRHWRNRNVGFILTTQRPAFVSKKVLALTDFVLLYRLTWPNDIKVVKELIGGMLPTQCDSVIASLQTQGFLHGYSVNFIPEMMKI